MTSCNLGKYEIVLEKRGRQIDPGLAQPVQINWSRVLDAPSTAGVEFATTGTDCCGQLAMVDHWNTDLILAVEGDVVWRGPVKKPVYRRGSMSIAAADNLEWMQVRVLPEDIDFVDTDVSDIFVGLWNSAVASVDEPHSSLVVYKSNVAESRKIEASARRMAWNVVTEMLETGLDVTTFGSRIIVGIPAFDPINLTDADVQGEIEVIKDGDEFANRALSNVSADIQGAYPVARAPGENGYPLVETVISDSQLQDQASADNAAKARYDFSSRGVRRVRANGGLTLLPSAKINPLTTIAGQLVTFSANETCYAATETLRLGRMDVTVQAGRELVTIELQPMGAVQGLL